ncbi:MAG TPA: SHOCT domain-containing protein [Candidatus Paceibacterota bacterium]|nr:SHOCT domain-containing protein [Candidatus Paceibacterota bacterium]
MGIFTSKAREREKLKATLIPLIAEKDKFLKDAVAMKRIPTITPPASLILEKDERLILADPTTLREARAVRESSGGFGSVRVGHARIGSYSGTSFSTLKWADLDKGSLYLTNHRLIFQGNKENRIIPLKSISALQPIPFGTISMSVVNKPKNMQFPVRNPYLWEAVTKIERTSLGDNIVLKKAQAQNGNLDDLEKLADLKGKGIITDDEFAAKKKQILGL